MRTTLFDYLSKFLTLWIIMKDHAWLTCHYMESGRYEKHAIFMCRMTNVAPGITMRVLTRSVRQCVYAQKAILKKVSSSHYHKIYRVIGI